MATKASGGGILAEAGAAVLSVALGTFLSNQAAKWGGGIATTGAAHAQLVLTVTDTTFTGDTSKEQGHAIFAFAPASVSVWSTSYLPFDERRTVFIGGAKDGCSVHSDSSSVCRAPQVCAYSKYSKYCKNNDGKAPPPPPCSAKDPNSGSSTPTPAPSTTCTNPVPVNYGTWTKPPFGEYVNGFSTELTCKDGFTPEDPLSARMTCRAGLWTYSGEYGACVKGAPPSPRGAPSPPPARGYTNQTSPSSSSTAGGDAAAGGACKQTVETTKGPFIGGLVTGLSLPILCLISYCSKKRTKVGAGGLDKDLESIYQASNPVSGSGGLVDEAF